MTSTNLNIILTNAVCCSAKLASKVSKLYSIGDKCADSELAKLKLLNDYIETLRCYKIDTVNTVFKVRLDGSDYNSLLLSISNSNFKYAIVIDNIEYSFIGDNLSKVEELLIPLIQNIPNVISVDLDVSVNIKVDGYAYLAINTNCDVSTINYKILKVSDSGEILNVNIPLTQKGVCTVSNCLTDEEYQTLIEYVMSTCDICDCQLTT